MPGTYTFTIIDSINHPLIKVVTINASTETCPVSIHNAFSPNGDGLNETFFIDRIEAYPSNHVYIYNRYGQIMELPGDNNTNIVWGGENTRRKNIVCRHLFLYYRD